MGQVAPFVTELQNHIETICEIINDPGTDAVSRKIALRHLVQVLRACVPKNKWETGFVTHTDPYLTDGGVELCYMHYSTKKESGQMCGADLFGHHEFQCHDLYRLAVRLIDRFVVWYGIKRIDRLESC